MNAINHPIADTTPAYGSPEERWTALSAQIEAALDLAAAYTDFPPTLEVVRQLRKRFDWFKRAGSPEHALGACGPNGMWPAIDNAMSSARYHGFNWRERARAIEPVLFGWRAS